MGINILATVVVLALSSLVSIAESQKYCNYGGPRDRDTLNGVSYISNRGTGDCLKLQGFNVNNRIPIILDNCQWDSRSPQRDQIFLVKNSGSGSVLQPAQKNTASLCLGTHDGKLSTKLCAPKSDEQTWNIRNVRGDDYQIIQASSGRCLKVNSGFGTNNVVIVPCSSSDKLQQWRVCTANN